MVDVRTVPQPADFADVRATNLAVVLRQVRAAAPCSRADIAASTGLNKATVSSLVAELIDRRMLRETGLTENRIGRPATMLVIDGSGYAGIGLAVGVDNLTAIAVDLAGRRVLTWRRSFAVPDKPPSRVVAELARLARRAVARVQAAGGSVVGLTVAVPGLVDPAGVVCSAPALDWRDLELRPALERALGAPEYPVGVDSDATLGAVAEYRYGAHAGTPHLAYLTGEVGVRVGLISGGVPVRGARGYAGELGHLPVAPAGPVCSCGRTGCLEAVAGVDALLRRIGGGPREANGARDLSARDLEVADLARRAAAGEDRVRTAIHELGTGLGYAVALLGNLLDPEVIVLGGHYAPLSPWLLPAVEREHRALAVAPVAGGFAIAASNLGYEASALGGAAVVLDAVDSAGAAFPRPA